MSRSERTGAPGLPVVVACVLAAAACSVAGPSTPESAGLPVVVPPPSGTSPGDAGDPNETSADSGIGFPSWDAGADATSSSPAPVPQPGEAGVERIVINGICCYGGKYFACPNAAACFGGFDVSACLATCSGPEDPCFDACFAKEDSAGPPLGCAADMAAPPGVDCATGNIQIGQ